MGWSRPIIGRNEHCDQQSLRAKYRSVRKTPPVPRPSPLSSPSCRPRYNKGFIPPSNICGISSHLNLTMIPVASEQNYPKLVQEPSFATVATTHHGGRRGTVDPLINYAWIITALHNAAEPIRYWCLLSIVPYLTIVEQSDAFELGKGLANRS